jgi:hypothetical protein
MHEIMLCSTKYLQFIYHKVLTILQFTFAQDLYTECEINVSSANDSCVLIFVFVLLFLFFVLCFCLVLLSNSYFNLIPLSQYDTCVSI